MSDGRADPGFTSIVKALQAGATPAQLDSAQQALGHPIPAELRQSFAWLNGQNHEVVGTLERSFHLASVEKLVTLTRDLAHRPPAGWQPGFFPFLVSDSDSYVVVASEQPGCPVPEVWHGKTSHPEVAPSLLACWLSVAMISPAQFA